MMFGRGYASRIWKKYSNSKNSKNGPESKDRTTSCIVRTRTYPTFWSFFVRTYQPTPTLPFNNNADSITWFQRFRNFFSTK